MDGGEHEVEAESSSQRRERLLALRSAATAHPAEAPPRAPAGGSLLPDPDLSGGQAPLPGPRPHQRFDYYTNPAAAFSSHSSGATYPPHKRKSPPACYDPPPPTGNYGSNHRTPHQQHMAPSPVHSPSPMPRDASGSSPWQSAMEFQHPMSGYQGAPPGTPPHSGPHIGPRGRGSYPNPPNYGFRHPNPGRGGIPINYGPRGSPYSSYGQVRGPNYYGSPGSRGRGGRGGIGFQNHPGWQNRSYCNKSMVDDPWIDLQPVVGNILLPRARGDSKSWLPESLREKKETPAQGQIELTSGLSLAEYLDLSFNEVSDK